MKLNPFKSVLALSLLAIAAFPLQAQFVAGQYEDEAPFRTWNSFPYGGAAALGRGQTVFAWGTDAAASPANPALLLTLPKWTVSAGASLQSATFLKYGPVNSGVLSATEPLGRNLLSADHLAVSFHSGRWALAAAVFLSEAYDRPLTDVSDRYSFGTFQTRFEQSGALRTFHLAAAFRISASIGFGLGLNVDSGSIEIEMFEDYFGWYQITGTKSAGISGLSLNGGLSWDISPAIRAALTFRTPFTLKVRMETVDRFSFPAAGTDISINGTSDDSFDRPLVIGAGMSAQAAPRLRVMADVSLLRWSACDTVWLGQARDRNFRDVLRLAAGGEYAAKVRMFGKNGLSPFRLGIVYDPQPTPGPKSAYAGFTIGAGLEIGGFRLDLGALISFESGSGDKLRGNRISLGFGYTF